MSNDIKVLLAAIFSCAGGFWLGRQKWTNKKIRKDMEYLCSMSDILADLVGWTCEEGIEMDHNEFVEEFLERLTFVYIAAHEAK